MTARYDAKWVEQFYDEYGEKEWDRLVRHPEDEVKLHVHKHYLVKYVNTGDDVLEIGPGPGRFTQILVEMGAAVTAVDISQVQLDLNRQYAQKHDFEAGVRERHKLDICDMNCLATAAYDAVVCYGGPLSYVFDQAGEALAEIRRVLKPDGVALLSVMSMWGTVHKYLDGFLKLPVEVNRAIVSTGDLCPANYPENEHNCRMYSPDQLRQLLESVGLKVLDMSASNCLSTVWGERLAEARKDPVQWQQLLELELAACREPGCLDMGTHLIAIARKEK